MKGVSNWPPPPPLGKNYPQKSPGLLGLKLVSIIPVIRECMLASPLKK